MTTGVTDFNPPSQGGTRQALLAIYSLTGNPTDAEAARKAGATQLELRKAKSKQHRGGFSEEDIAYEEGSFWVLRVPHGFDIYQSGITHSTRCAQIGFHGDTGLNKAKAEIARRLAKA